MRYILFMLLLVFLLSGCSGQGKLPEPTQSDIVLIDTPSDSIPNDIPSDIIITITPSENSLIDTPKPNHYCGDGICDGPENAESCPDDCQITPITTPKARLDKTPPLNFFYAIHAHGSKEFLPYADPGMTTVDPEVAENMIAAIEGIAAQLNKYGIKGTWEFLPATIRGIVSYQGENKIFHELLSRGHEIGIHAHKVEDIPAAVQALQECCGISPQTTSGFIAQISKAGVSEAQAAMSDAIAIPVNLGLSVGTTNLTPGGNKNTLSTSCNEKFGVGNDMWMDTGNLMFPWRPDYAHEDICTDNPESNMIFVDHVSIESLILSDAVSPPDVLDPRHFNQLRGQFDSALSYMADNQPDRVAVWGFVTHIIEYAIGGQGENPPDIASLEALNDFLSYVDSKFKDGLVVYATASEIANKISLEEK